MPLSSFFGTARSSKHALPSHLSPEKYIIIIFDCPLHIAVNRYFFPFFSTDALKDHFLFFRSDLGRPSILPYSRRLFVLNVYINVFGSKGHQIPQFSHRFTDSAVPHSHMTRISKKRKICVFLIRSVSRPIVIDVKNDHYFIVCRVFEVGRDVGELIFTIGP